ncbi:hypothetical protein SAMD00079811_15700 [Scytonema sp. HK-05]|nr:hypothetical protein NIES2130_14970 [Scytonema sp. HK-05]BAY43976.1 hypothetical protein SAMD00079811_15700 [Scytonema sp. HK-05]
MGGFCVPFMKDSRLSLRISTRRLNKLRSYAASKDKTVTQIVEDWVDRLPNTEIGALIALSPFPLLTTQKIGQGMCLERSVIDPTLPLRVRRGINDRLR